MAARSCVDCESIAEIVGTEARGNSRSWSWFGPRFDETLHEQYKRRRDTVPVVARVVTRRNHHVTAFGCEPSRKRGMGRPGHSA